MMTCVSTIGTEGETKGLISAAIPINSVSLRYSLDQMKPPMDGLALLIAEDGTVFAADNATTEKKGSYSNSKIDLELLEKDYLLRSTKLNSGQITVVVAIEKNKFYQPLKKLNSSLFICIILSLTLASVAGLWLTNGIARPIAKLVEGLKAAGDGIYSTRIQCPADPEIGESLKAFNGLMEKLQKRRLIEKLWNESWDV
jgi:nitrogen fixation/metabolism regulation signal transduction histidine kinase